MAVTVFRIDVVPSGASDSASCLREDVDAGLVFCSFCLLLPDFLGPSDDLAARLSLILALSSVDLPTTVDRVDLALLVATGTVDEEVRSAAIADWSTKRVAFN